MHTYDATSRILIPASAPRFLDRIVKFKAGELEIPNNVPFSVRRFCVDLRTTMCLAFKKKPGVRIHLACDKAVEDLILLGSPRHLRCVLRNLMANAIKFTPAGFVRLVVSVVEGTETPEAATLKFCVEDTGIGIEPAD